MTEIEMDRTPLHRTARQQEREPMIDPERSDRPTAKRMSIVRFDQSDLQLFSAASHDRNPLHLSETYARRTPYGQCVVFGILAAVAAVGRTVERPRLSLSRINITFRQPLFVGVDYRIEMEEPDLETARFSIHDGERLMVTATLTFAAAERHSAMPPTSIGAPRIAPVDRSVADVREGMNVRGSYAPSAPDLARLLERYGASRKALSVEAWTALLWCSYLIGMELPGERALFWSLEMRLPAHEVDWRAPFTYQATVARMNVQLEFAEIEAKLSAGSVTVASARLRVFIRRPSPVSNRATLETFLPTSEKLRGKVAVVVGGSRGLGAALAQALALQGCTVLVSYRQSSADAEQIRASVTGLLGSVELLQGDASDPGWCRDVLVPRVVAVGGLDILVCNASPAIRPLSLTLDEIDRFREFASSSLALVSVPMAALLGCLTSRSGWCVLISSSAVRTVPADWPHYVSAKAAAEGLVAWAAAKYKQVPFLIVRPGRLLTDQMNTVAGRQQAIPVEQAAATIVERLCRAPRGEMVEIMEV